MTNLRKYSPRGSFGDLLSCNNAGAGLQLNVETTITDGFGNNSPLSLSQTSISINAPLTLSGAINYTGPVTFSSTATFNSTVAFNDEVTFNNPTIFNGNSKFYGTVDIVGGLGVDGDVLVGGGNFQFLGGTTLAIPFGTTDPVPPVAGQLYLNFTSKLLRYYDGATWRDVIGVTPP